MIIKKILIVKPKVAEYKDENGNVIRTHYSYPKYYNAQHANHICYNYKDNKILKGGSISEGMLIYEAKEEEIKVLLKEDGVEEISYNNARIRGKKWKPKQIIDEKEREGFNIKDWIKDKTEISNKKLT